MIEYKYTSVRRTYNLFNTRYDYICRKYTYLLILLFIESYVGIIILIYYINLYRFIEKKNTINNYSILHNAIHIDYLFIIK